MTISNIKDRQLQSAFDHWLWAAAVLLFASSMTIYQIDLVPPSPDERATMLSAAFVDWENPAEFLKWNNSLHRSHMPGYYILAAIFGKLISSDIAVLRYVSVSLYFLFLALVYRLGRDFVAPVAGLFALVIVVSNAFFNFYIVDARPYPLFVLLSCATVWQYLRIMHRSDAPRKRDLVSLGAVVFALVMTHLFCATLLISLGFYHLFFLPRNRRWLMTGLVVTIAAVVNFPIVALVLTDYSVSLSHLEGKALKAIEAIAVWLMLMLNAQPAPLLLISVAGLYFGKQKLLLRLQSWLILPALFLITLGLLAEFSTFIRAATMRHQLDSWLLLVLFSAAGHYALYRWKPWLGLLILLWPLAGLSFQHAPNWWHYTTIRAAAFWHPPTQTLSSLALKEAIKPYLIGYPYTPVYSETLHMNYIVDINIPTSQNHYYFSQHGVEIDVAHEADEFVESVQQNALSSPKLWYFHRAYLANSAEVDLAKAELRRLNYRRCGNQKVGLDTIIHHYSWDLLDCRQPVDPVAFHTEFIEYELFKTGLNARKDAVLVIDRRTSRHDTDLSNYNMSYQLLSEDWNNVAQLDLPLVAENGLRQFSIDVPQVPPGEYRLMLILYHKTTGDRLAWEGNLGYVPAMLELGEITIDAS